MWALLPLAGLAGLWGFAYYAHKSGGAPMAPSANVVAAGTAAEDLALLADVSLRLISGKSSAAPTDAALARAQAVAHNYNLTGLATSLANHFQTWPQNEIWPGTQTLVTQFLTALWGQSQYRTLAS